MTSKAFGLAQLGNVYADGALSNRNLIINGAMQVAQRGTSSAGASSGNNYHTVDRFYLGILSLGTWTATQEADGPSGFSNSMKVECTTANASPASTGFVYIGHRMEGQNLQQIAKGTADAKPLVLSFWVKSNVTGTYQVSFVESDNTRMVAGTYSISSSGTWEYKTIDVAADTTGVLDNDNNNSLQIEWWLGSGTNYTTGTAPTAWEARNNTDRNAGSNVNVGDTIGNYFQLTGVQLEAGDTATPFEHRSYGAELALCERYCQRGNSNMIMHTITSTLGVLPWSNCTEFRATPTATGSSSPYVENLPWNSVGSATGVTYNMGHFTPKGGEIGVFGSYSPIPSYGNVWLINASGLILSAEL